ncbi:DUF1642 domain-containing protein [Enterococcus hirae]|nr:DUF1642 domain-containing protein [Enterococcus hirae]MCC1500990.1 DUF1642 domain-containing protein [Enterococcus hirae]
MNKQELINELTKYVERYEDATDEYDQGKSSAYEVALKLAKKLRLDEPQKPVVPQFVGDWIELCKEKADLISCLSGSYEYGVDQYKRITEDEDWLFEADHQELVARAWLFGYEVKKEPRIYRKKPVVVEAMLLTEENLLEVKEWCNGELVPNAETSGYDLYISTLEGIMHADINDYIIQGVEGEFYPCKPDIFEKTYEVVEE